jgi:transposase
MADPNVDLWAQDEVHFQQHGSRCRMWVPPESVDPVLYHAPTRKSIGYFGAVRLRDGKLAYRREPDKFNAESFFAHLKQLHGHAGRCARRVVCILDNAKYHHARLHLEWRIAHRDRIDLLYLPPYSPELNPVERVWKLTRRLCLHNRYFPTLGDVLDAVERQFVQWATPNDTLRRLCATS